MLASFLNTGSLEQIMADVLKVRIDRWRIAAMLLYTHNEAAESFAQAREAEAQAGNDLKAVRRWRMTRESIAVLRQAAPHMKKRLH